MLKPAAMPANEEELRRAVSEKAEILCSQCHQHHMPDMIRSGSFEKFCDACKRVTRWAAYGK